MTSPDTLLPAWTIRCPVSVGVLPAGTLLYHGTDNDNFAEAGDALDGPAWLSNTEAVARHFASRTFRWGGTARVVVYRLTESILLPAAHSNHELGELAEEFQLNLCGVEGMRDSMQSSGLPGWWIPANYPDGDDILLTHTNLLEYVETRPLAETPKSEPETVVPNAVQATLEQARRERALHELREEHRLKYGTDFATTFKYGELHVLCHTVFEDQIRETLEKHNVPVASWHTYE